MTSNSQPTKVTIVGTGYVGLVMAACLADLGNSVTCLDIDSDKINSLAKGVIPIREPGLDELVSRNLRSERLSFTADFSLAGLEDASLVFITVGTPAYTDGASDLRALTSAVKAIAPYLQAGSVVVVKSTVPPGTTDVVASALARHRGVSKIDAVFNPEFLREGRAVEDAFHPERIVIGSRSLRATDRLVQLWASLERPFLVSDPPTAEMIKLASNAFLATKISFINEMAAICDRVDADVSIVAHGMGLDPRIEGSYLNAGLGFGGSCLPKDLLSLIHTASAQGCDPMVLRATHAVNQRQRTLIVDMVRSELGALAGRVIGVLGLAFKPETDDIRDAPAIDIISKLHAEAAVTRVFDPMSTEKVHSTSPPSVICDDAYDAAKGADALLLVTDWKEFTTLDWKRVQEAMRNPLIIDGRNVLDPSTVRNAGLRYIGIGRGTSGATQVGEPVKSLIQEYFGQGQLEMDSRNIE